MATPEGKFKQDFCDDLRELGCVPVPYVQTMWSRKGFPDYLILLPEGLTVYIEFKASKTAKFQPGQKEWVERLKKMGYFVWVCYPGNRNQVLKEIKELI